MRKKIIIFLLKLFGWTINYDIPKEAQRCVMTAAPHTSNWDAIITRLSFFVLDIPVKIAIKNSWTKFPIGLFIVPLGGLGIDRSPKDPNKPRKSQTEQMADFFSKYERIALVISPEGSRSLRKQWKMGFYYVARQANVPITFGYLDYANKIAGVGGVLYPTDDIDADMRVVINFYKDIKGLYPENFTPDERYLLPQDAK